MTTARTQEHHVTRGGAARPRVADLTPDDYAPVSAESFGEVTIASSGEVEAFDPSTLDFDPADHTVEEVKEYVEANPQTADAILELELNGKERSGLLSFLDNFTTESED
jgi:hypothetical protein